MVMLKKLNVEDKLAAYNNISEENLEGLRNSLQENQKLLNTTTEVLKDAKVRFEEIKKVLIKKDDKNFDEYEVQSVRYQKDIVLLKSDFTSRGVAEVVISQS